MRLSRIQRMIVHRPNEPAKAILFFNFQRRIAARDFLRQIIDRVPSATQSPAYGTPIFHIALTWNGIAKLAEGHPDLEPAEGRRQLEPAFVDQTATAFSHPEELGFVDDSAPSFWWGQAWLNHDIDIAVYVFADDNAGLGAQLEELRSLAKQNGLRPLELTSFSEGTLAGHTPRGGILHFGFRDGITQPDIDWNEDGSGQVDHREILLGDRNSDYPSSPFKDGPWKDFVRDGSMACVAWIAQDVAAFDRLLDEGATQLQGFAPAGRERDWLASRLMGRWPDGSPVIRYPEAPPATPDLQDDSFGFGGDPDGRVCPLNAHIRVTNLRDDRMTAANRLVFPNGPPRFVRRGFSYGPPYAPGDDPDIPRGLVGTFFCARVNEQFLKVLRWIQRTDFSEQFAKLPHTTRMQDACFGMRNGSVTPDVVLGPEGGETRKLSLRPFISYRGVAILLMPSLPSLRMLTI